MEDVIVTGASRGIGRALVRRLASADRRLVLVARDAARLETLAAEIGKDAVALAGDLGSLAGARAIGERLAEIVRPGATLIHNAGLWPSKRQLTADGLEAAFAVNHLGPYVMQEPLFPKLRRIMVVSAGILVKGRFDGEQTPRGEDFSLFRTYASTKLAFAVAMRDVAKAHPGIDVLVLHPGVVRTDLGAMPPPLGWLLALVKRSWESPETCAERLARILARERWSTPGVAAWMFEEAEQDWPEITGDAATREAVRAATTRLRAHGSCGSASSNARASLLR